MNTYEIECSNMFYISNFNVIGGVETFIYELARKYKKYDITVVYKTGNPKQLSRLIKYVRVHKYKEGKIKCKKAFFNYEIDIIDNVDSEEYIQIIHALFKTNRLTPKLHPKITKYLAVSKSAAEEWEELTGFHADVCKNPLVITEEEQSDILLLLSATRLTEEKGKGRMEILANELDKAGINYLWYVFTNDKNAINNPNVIFINPRLNIRPIMASIKGRGYGVQLSDCEGDCYFTRECEALGIPLIVTPIPSFKEQGLIEGVNCYYMPFDMNNINVERIINIPSYEGYLLEDKWEENLLKEESNYKEENMKVKLRVIRSYFDVLLSPTMDNKDLPLNFEFVVSKERADELLDNPNNLVEFVDNIIEPAQKPIEKAVKPKRNVTKR